jgi:hypothetical protein
VRTRKAGNSSEKSDEQTPVMSELARIVLLNEKKRLEQNRNYKLGLEKAQIALKQRLTRGNNVAQNR